MKIRLLALLMLLGFGTMHAQKGPKNWFNLDLEKDGINGMSSERAYAELLKGKNSKTVVVAVIDGGVDPYHEDLKDVMWHNPGEIAGNGIDDDHNGYVDDVYGWNFIGGKDGKNVGPDQLEVTRLFVKYDKKYKNANPAALSKKERKEYDRYLAIKEEVTDKREKAKQGLEQMKSTKDRLGKALDALAAAMDGAPLT
ncbi:MAG TPA: peptidase S8, partial [Saprospiraceae bacterium]|nr:peptidase S8 [Saprospiraceae bacterium]